MAAESELEVRVKGRDELSPTLQALESKVIRWVGAVSAAIAAVKIGAAPVKAAADLERELANVAKTTDFLPSQIKELSDGLLELSRHTNVATLDLVKIAAAAGQQGLGKDGVAGVLQFTDSVSRMASVLDVTAEQAGADIGKIINIFKTPLSDIERIISSFNETSNNSTAKGEELLDVVKRIGDATGKLKVSEAIGFAATGLDFGISPEVVGSTFTAIFSKVDAKAAEFARLLKIGTKDWLNLIEHDGVTAVNKVVEALRGLNRADQQEAIAKLIGAGRQGGLVNKLIQDTTNSVQNKNLQNADKGFESAISALKEQATVMKTLVSQSQAAMNSLFKLGVDVTNQTLAPLTQYVRQLNEALQSPKLKGFLTSVANAVLDMVTSLVSAVKFVADLNINWENFVKVATLFLKLKLAEFFLTKLAGGAGAYGDKLRYVMTGQAGVAAGAEKIAAANNAAAASEAAAASRSKGAIAARLLGYEELYQKIQAQKAATAELAAAEARAAVASKAAQEARAATVVATSTHAANTTRLTRASDVVSGQSQALKNAQAAAAAEELRVQEAKNLRLQELQTQSNVRLIAIEEDFQVKKAAIRATGSTKGLVAAKVERDALIAAEAESYTKRIVGVESYYARRTAIAVAAGVALVAAEKAALAKSLSTFDTAFKSQAASGVQTAGVVAGAAAAEAALLKASAATNAAKLSADGASKSMITLGGAFTTLGRVVAAMGRLVAGGFFWVTIIVSVLDLLGVLDKFPAVLQRLSDFLGITSDKQRQLAQAQAEAAQKAKDHEKALDELIDKYKELIDVSGRLTDLGKTNVAGLRTQFLLAEDDEGRARALAKFAEFAKAIEAEGKKATLVMGRASNEQLDHERDNIVKFTQEIFELKKQIGLNVPVIGGDGFTPAAQLGLSAEQAQPKIEALEAAIKKAEGTIRDLGGVVDQQAEKIRNTGKEAQELNKSFAGMFTQETLHFAEQYLTAFQQLQVSAKEAGDEAKKAQDKFLASGNKDDETAATVAIKKFDDLRLQISQTRKELIAYVQAQMAMPGVSEAFINSWRIVLTLIRGSADQLERTITGVQEAVKVDKKAADGSLVSKEAPKKASGTGNFTAGGDKSAESRARREAKARLELKRAGIQAENALADEQSKQLLDADTRLFDRGLKAIKDYYDARRRLQLEANARDIADKNLEIEAAELEVKGAKEKADKDKFQAVVVRLRGQARVLEEQKKAINAQIDEDTRRADKSFTDRIRSETNRLVQEGIIPREAVDTYKATLEEMEAQWEITLAGLIASGTPAALKLAADLRKAFQFTGVKEALAPITQELNLTFDNLSRFQTRLGLGVTNGLLTTQQSMAAYNEAIKATIPTLQTLIDKQEESLRQMVAVEQQGTPAYKQLQSEIDNTRLRLEQLSAEQDKVAKDFNKQTTDSLANLLGNLEPTFKSLREGFLGFLKSIAQNIQQTLGKDIAEQITQALGQSGSGGLGGFIQSILHGGAPGIKAGSAAALAKGKGFQLGSSPANPIYTRDADKAAAGVTEGKKAEDVFKKAAEKGDSTDFLANAAENKKVDDFFSKIAEKGDSTDFLAQASDGDKLTEAVDGITEKLDGAFDGMTESISGTFEGVASDLSGTLGGVFDDLGSSLGDLVGGLTSNLGDVFNDLVSAFSGGGGGGGGWVGLIASLFHSGGIAGQGGGRRRMVAPAIFANAPRYHTGGIAGLQPDETPAILKKGEEVLTERDARHRDNLSTIGKNTGKEREMNLRNVLVVDKDFVPSSMQTAQGESVVMSILSKNAGTIRRIVKG